MVKPAMPYLDVIAAARARLDLPIAGYQVNGEYAMIEAAARNNWTERDRDDGIVNLDPPCGGKYYSDLLREGRGEAGMS
jgi:hypothetical protein